MVRTILSAEDGITDELAFKSSDLTPDGLSLMKACYDKWLRRIDRGMPPDDVTILEKGLQKIRQAS